MSDTAGGFRLGRRVLVVGDLMLDVYTEGIADRLSPEAPVPVVRAAKRWSTPGGAGNAVSNLAALGECVEVVGVVGSDDAGDELIAALRAAGEVRTETIIKTADRTATKHRIVAHGQQLVRVDVEADPALPRECGLLDFVTALISRVDAVLISDYGKGVCFATLCRAIIGSALELGVPVIVDPKGRDFAKYYGCQVITPNLAEAAVAVPGGDDVDELGTGVQRIVGGATLLTRGPDGMTLYEADGRRSHFPAAARTVFDVTGAGDTVAAVLTFALARGLTLASACQLANECAGRVVGIRGTVPIGLGDLVEIFGEMNNGVASNPIRP